MYRFLVAEDSKVILRDIVHLIQEAGYEAEIETAYDGEMALEILREFAPDIIVTDIKMPVIDGLALIQRAKAAYPGVKCVIVSGYGDFIFTHEAIMLQVDDYVMKPIDGEEFGKILEKLTKEADCYRVQMEEAALQRLIHDGEGAKDQTSNISGLDPGEHWEISTQQKVAESLSAGIRGKVRDLCGSYMLVLIRIGLFHQYAAPLSKEMVNRILERDGSKPEFWTVNTRWNNEKLLVFGLDGRGRKNILLQCAVLLSELQKEYSRVNIICSGELSDISRLHAQYSRLSVRLGRKVMLDRCMVYDDEIQPDARRQYIRQKEEIEVFRKKMEKILRSRAIKDYGSEIHKNILHWEKMGYSVAVLHKYLLALLDEMFTVAGIGSGWIEEPGTMVDKMLNGCGKLEELEKCLQEYGELLASGKEEKGGVSIEVAQQLTEYMQANLYKNLSLQEIADNFNISSSYICRIFKVYYSDTPISYYNRLKIAEAKKMLDEYKDMRVKDVAELLGFSDQYYFSKVFKQQYGVSPLVYRTQTQEG